MPGAKRPRRNNFTTGKQKFQTKEDELIAKNMDISHISIYGLYNPYDSDAEFILNGFISKANTAVNSNTVANEATSKNEDIISCPTTSLHKTTTSSMSVINEELSEVEVESNECLSSSVTEDELSASSLESTEPKQKKRKLSPKRTKLNNIQEMVPCESESVLPSKLLLSTPSEKNKVSNVEIEPEISSSASHAEDEISESSIITQSKEENIKLAPKQQTIAYKTQQDMFFGAKIKSIEQLMKYQVKEESRKEKLHELQMKHEKLQIELLELKLKKEKLLLENMKLKAQ